MKYNMKLKATRNQRIRVNWEKVDVKKGQVVDIPAHDEFLFKTHWFIEIKMEDKTKDEIKVEAPLVEVEATEEVEVEEVKEEVVKEEVVEDKPKKETKDKPKIETK